MLDMILFYATVFYQRLSFLSQGFNAVSLQHEQPEDKRCQNGTVFKWTIHDRMH